MTIYKRGVERFTSVTENATYRLSLATIIQEYKAFCKADELWKSLQDGIKKFLKDNGGGESVFSFYPPFNVKKGKLVNRFLVPHSLSTMMICL